MPWNKGEQMTRLERAKRRMRVLMKKGYGELTARKKAFMEFGVTN